MDITAINEKIREKSSFVDALKKEIGKKVIAQDVMVERILIALFSNGHVLLEGVPGLAKTLTVTTVAEALDVSFKRIQFTPDLLPADLTGSLMYDTRSGEFIAKKGPVFANVILADEVNRAPAKVQSAMLEAMQEKQVTLGNETYQLPKPFFVLATQNPIEQEGTYPLPEAKKDRFMLKVKVGYPTIEDEKRILSLYGTTQDIPVQRVLNPAAIDDVRAAIEEVYVDDGIKDYILRIVFATRFPDRYKLHKLKQFIDFGGSPRASLYLLKAAKAYAFLQRRGYVVPDDIKEMSFDVLRHRIIASFEAEAEGMTTDDIIREILANIEVP